MPEKKKSTKTTKAPAPELRKYTVLQLNPENSTWAQIAVVEAKDEKDARWKAVDQRDTLQAAVRSDNPPELVAISDRNWTPRITREEVIETAKRS